MPEQAAGTSEQVEELRSSRRSKQRDLFWQYSLPVSVLADSISYGKDKFMVTRKLILQYRVQTIFQSCS